MKDRQRSAPYAEEDSGGRTDVEAAIASTDIIEVSQRWPLKLPSPQGRERTRSLVTLLRCPLRSVVVEIKTRDPRSLGNTSQASR